jgi:hypothetical protein
MAEGLGYTPGAIGCALSHIAFWRACAAADGPVTVCEDDAIRIRISAGAPPPPPICNPIST